jgi:acyl-CoA synthetase (NDP forming)
MEEGIMPPEVVERILKTAREQGRSALLEPEAEDVCRAYEMTTPEFGLATSSSEAAKVAERISFPVVLKIISPDILHKTEVGGVVLGLNSKTAVEQAYHQIISNVRKNNSGARIVAVLVQHMAPRGVEVIIGGLRDRQFGPTVLFGLGGIFVEVLKDATFRVAPLTEHDAREMIRETHSYPILKGVRGQGPSDEEAIMQMLYATSKMMLEIEDISQIDLNPVMVYGSGATIVDARMILTERELRANQEE